MQQLYPDLWQCRPEQPFPEYPDLITRAYLLATDDGNLLIYNTGNESEIEEMARLGGVRRQYLSHVDEAGPALARIRAAFGAELWGHAAEAGAVAKASGVAPDRTFDAPETHFGKLEILPLPGHTAGSTCFQYRSPHGKVYLFTGDTLGIDGKGRWRAGYVPGISDRPTLLTTLVALGRLQPDVVFSSAFGDPWPYREVDAAGWARALDEAATRLRGNGAAVPRA